MWRLGVAAESGSETAAQGVVAVGVIEPVGPGMVAATAVVGAMVFFFLSGARRGLRSMGTMALRWFLGTLIVVGAIAVGLAPNPFIGVAIGAGAAVVVTTIAAIKEDGSRSHS